MLRQIKLFAANIFILLHSQRHCMRFTQTVRGKKWFRAEIWSEITRICLYQEQAVHSNRQTSDSFVLVFWCGTVRMYCLQWLIPVLLLPKPVRFSRNFLLTKCCDNFSQVNPALLYNHVMFIVLYLTGFFLEKKPCTICSLVSHNFYFSTFFKQFEF